VLAEPAHDHGFELGDGDGGDALAGERLVQRVADAEAADQHVQAFARQVQRATGVPELGMFTGVKPLEGQQAEGGSTDVADVSWVVPTLHVSVATSPLGAPWHAWPVVASGGMSIGHKGLLRAAKVMAATMADRIVQFDVATLAPLRSIAVEGEPDGLASTDVLQRAACHACAAD